MNFENTSENFSKIFWEVCKKITKIFENYFEN